MAKLKRAHSILNWDVLDKFYDEKVLGVNMKPNGNERSFCRCGNTTNTFSDKCEACGNFSFINIKNEALNNYKKPSITFYNGDEVEFGYSAKFLNKNEEFLAQGKSLSFKEDSKGEISFKIDYSTIVDINDKETTINLGTSHTYYYYYNYKESFTTLLEKFPEVIDIFEENGDFLKDKYSKLLKIIPNKVRKFVGTNIKDCELSDFEKVCAAALLTYKANYFINDPLVSRYPNILKGYIHDFTLRYLYNSYDYGDYSANQTLEEKFKVLKGNYEIMEFFAKECGSLSLRYCEGYESNDSILNFANIFIEKSNIITGYEDIIFNYVKNGMILYPEAIHIYEKLCTVLNLRDMTVLKRSHGPIGFKRNWKHYYPYNPSRWEEESYKDHIDFNKFLTKDIVEDFFTVYLKETISNRKIDLIEGFIEQIKTMLDYKIPIKAENFKIKNYNFLVNHARLAEIYKLPQDKVDMFLDMFETNPLEAMSLIANRRKMTKKEQEAFLEIMLRQ